MITSLLTRLGLVCLVGASLVSGGVATPESAELAKIAREKAQLAAAQTFLGTKDDPWEGATLLTTTTQANIGVCTYVRIGAPAGGHYFMNYCDTGGNGVYQLWFSDDACTVPTQGTMVSTNGYSSPDAMVFCQAYDASPVQPLGAWPPVGWFTARTNFDTTTGLTTCTPADGSTVLEQSLVITPFNTCQPRPYTGGISPQAQPWAAIQPGASFNPNYYIGSYCTDSFCTSQYGFATYTDSACLTNAIAARIKPTGCLGDVATGCEGGGCATFPSVMPLFTRTTFANPTCDAGTNAMETVIDLYADSTCIDGSIVTCTQDSLGNWMMVYTSWGAPATEGACPTDADVNHWTTTPYLVDGTCYPDDNGITSKQYFCAGPEEAAKAKAVAAAKAKVEEKDL